MHINKKKVITALLLFACEGLGLLLIPKECSYQTMAVVSVIQLIINIVCIARTTKTNIFSFASLFLFLSWFFHCGQIIKMGFGISGFVPLDVTRYASINEIGFAFRYYCIMQLMVSIGMILYSNKTKTYFSNYSKKIFDAKKTCLWLCSIGLIPRIYIDYLVMKNGLSQGYVGVYSLTIPQIIQTLAFFFDAGCIVAMMNNKDGKKHTMLFWMVLAYKCITMSTGARQEKIAFLIIWVFLYYYIVHDFKIKDFIFLTLLFIVGVLLINAIGVVRSSGNITFMSIIRNLSPNAENNIIGNMLGEFGSALTTLATTIREVPNHVAHGYGDSYLAGLLSIIPTLTNRVGLGDATAYISKIRGTTYFGGSYIGELYYNFSWFGIIGGIVLGVGIMFAQTQIFECKKHSLTQKGVFAAIVMISFYLFVRGYFTDMVQRLVWIWFLLCLINRKREM